MNTFFNKKDPRLISTHKRSVTNTSKIPAGKTQVNSFTSLNAQEEFPNIFLHISMWCNRKAGLFPCPSRYKSQRFVNMFVDIPTGKQGTGDNL